MMGGPQVTKIALSGVGFSSSKTLGAKPTLPSPVGSLTAGVNSLDQRDAIDFRPLVHFALVNQIGDRSGCVEDEDFIVEFSVVKAVLHHAPQSDRADSAADEVKPFALPLLNGEPVAVGTAKADGLTDFHVRKALVTLPTWRKVHSM
jgi:hypothetical protein